MPKNVEGRLGFLNIQFVAKHEKMKSDNLETLIKFRKSLSAEKKPGHKNVFVR